MSDEPARCLIVDDESPARDELRYLLRDIEGVVVVGEAATVEEARVLLSSVGYDIVFLDIRMPGETGLDLARLLRDSPSDTAVVFTTAYPDHALEAFDLAATDYLLKPFDGERLEEAVARALARQTRTKSEPAQPGVSDRPGRAGRSPRPEYRSRLLVQKGDRTVLIDETDVVYASAARGYTYLKLATERVLVSYSLAELAERLGDRAFRAHRSHLVNLDHVEELAPYFGGQLVLVMRDQDRSRIPVSRRQARELPRILGM
jgi:DNA-binding LytR/AlgR family response regulator